MLVILVIYFEYCLYPSLECKFHLGRNFYLFHSPLEFSVPIRSLNQERVQLIFVEWINKLWETNLDLHSCSFHLCIVVVDWVTKWFEFFTPSCICPLQCDFAGLPYQEVTSISSFVESGLTFWLVLVNKIRANVSVLALNLGLQGPNLLPFPFLEQSLSWKQAQAILLEDKWLCGRETIILPENILD